MKVSVGIVVHNKAVLLIKRRKQEGNLLWQFPAGQIEQGETSRQATEREVLEETAIVCNTVKKLGKRTHPDTHIEMHYWFCHYISGQPSPQESEVAEVIWCPINQLNDYIKTDVFLPVKNYLNALAHELSD